MEYFDILKAIFDKKLWQTVTEDDKYKYFFLINRVLSIQYPVEINACQIVGLGKRNSAIMLDCWNLALTAKYTRVPTWIYTKTGTKDTVENHLKGIDKDVISDFMRHHEINDKDVSFLTKILGKELRKEILDFRKSSV